VKRELPVLAPPHVSADEVERLLQRVAAEHGGVITERLALDDPPAATRLTVRAPQLGRGAIEVTVTPMRVWLAVDDRRDPVWAGPRAGSIARRLSELLAE
jgi:hypothetical protein